MDNQILLTILDVSRKMAETRTLPPLLDYALSVALNLFDAQYGYLVLLREDGTLDFRVRLDRNGKNIPHPETQISQTLLRQVMSSGEAILTANAQNDPTLSIATSVSELQLRSVMCVPLITQGQVIGGMYIENRDLDDLFTDEELHLLQYLASQAAVCIANAILNDQLEYLVRQVANQAKNPVDSRNLQSVLEQERVRILSSFIQDASHQFRTPLAVINTSADILRRKVDMQTVGSYVETIHGQVVTMNKLVDSLVMMVRLDSGVALKTERIELNSILWDMNLSFRDFAADRGIRLYLDLPETPLQIHADVEYVRIALGAIIDNALHFTSRGGEINTRLVQGANAVLIEIHDTGTGIAPEDLPQIFSRFFRADKSGTSRGFGLGLSIAKRIMELHHGSIEVETELGRGSVFRLVFPTA